MVDPLRSALQLRLGSVVLALAMLLPHSGYAAAQGDAIVGNWLTEDGSSRVEIAATTAPDGGAVYSGKVSWLKVPARDGKPLLDVNNGNAALRGRPILGLEIISGFRVGTGAGWTGGTLYSPRNGKSYPAELSLTADGRLQVKVKSGIVSRTVYWSR